MKKRNIKKTITGWALHVTWSDGRDETILDVDDETARAVDTFLSEKEDNDFLDRQSNAEYYDTKN
jgi:hypothetical protein